MNIKHMIAGLVVASMLALSTIGAAVAGPFETFAAPLETYYGSGANGQPEVPDFHFTKAEFGNTNFGAILHLGAEAVVAHFNGYTVVYNPATDSVDVYVNAGAEGDDHNPNVIPNKWCAALAVSDPSHPKLRQGGYCDYATSNATLAPKSGGMTYTHTIAATERECTFETNDKNGDPSGHEHSC